MVCVVPFLIIMMERLRASHQQFNSILKFMESHGDLSRPAPGLMGKLETERLWQELTNSLNSMGGCSVNKTADKWKRVWSDWKTKTKRKAVIMSKNKHGLEGGKPLSNLEERLLCLMGLTTNTGHQESVEEQNFEMPQYSEVTTDVPSIHPDFIKVELEMESSPEPDPNGKVQHEKYYNFDSSTPTRLASPSLAPEHHERQQRRRRHTRLNRTSELMAMENNLRHQRLVNAQFLKIERERLKIDSERVRLEAERLRLEDERLRLEAERIRVEKTRIQNEMILRESINTFSNCVTMLLTNLSTCNNL